MGFPRSSGILCHPTSFPSAHGIGDLGSGAYDFLDWLHAAGQSLWQVLPLGPTGYGDSPYQSFSTFAGNPLLVSPEKLVDAGLLYPDSLDGLPDFGADCVDFPAVIRHKEALLHRSYAYFREHASEGQHARFTAYRDENSHWLADFGLFMAIKAHFGGGSWQEWPRELAIREAGMLAHYRELLADESTYHEFVQWVFAEQWAALKAYAASLGIQIVGDVPIFVAEDSADVWGRPDLFKLDEHNRPTVIAGVPPDNFSETGQRWGNPHYRWDVMEKNGFLWWIERIRQLLFRVDIVRIDHFRGFEAAWEIPAEEPTAVRGEWVPGPGGKLFEAISQALGVLPIIAEDLGIITAEVDTLRLRFGFPGMKILQFAFALDTASKYLPHNFERDYIVYPGTHDNNTVIGWFNEEKRTAAEKAHCLRYLDSDGSDLAWDFVRTAWRSVANQAVVNLQDVMSLGNEARMNFPSTLGGNWQWRYSSDMLTFALGERLKMMTALFGRLAVGD